MNDQQQQTITNKTPHFSVANRGNNLARLRIKQILGMQFWMTKKHSLLV
jgi:hypothetical protein